MNIQAIYHRPESNYCFAEDQKTVVLRLRFAKGEAVSDVTVVYETKYHIVRRRLERPMELIGSDTYFDYYGVRLELNDSRLAYVFTFVYDGKTYYYCEDGLVDRYDFELAYFNCFQFAYINKSDVVKKVDWLTNAVFYQIFVDRFCRSGKCLAEVNTVWGDKPTPKSIFGGDLYGITAHLDHIRALGVNALYLTPVFVSKSNHKYDISDYYHVDDAFGGNDALKELVDKAHSMGMRVVLDAVFNHVSKDFPPFVDVVKNGKKSKYFDWFIIEGDNVSVDPLNYCCFAECAYMPRLDTCNPEVQRYLLDIAVYWVREYGIDGWRLDVSDEVSHEFWRKMRSELKKISEDIVLIGENWHNSESFLEGDQFDSIMNYAITKRMVDFFANQTLNAKELAEQMTSLYMRYSDTVNDMMFNLLDCHDTHRFYSLVGEDVDKLACAIAVMVFLPGSYNLYYGTEILLEGGYDPDSRRTFDFDRLKDPEVEAFTDVLKKVLALKSQPAVKDGIVRFYEEDGAFVVERKNDVQTLKLYVSRGNTPLEGGGILDYNITDGSTAVSFTVKGV